MSGRMVWLGGAVAAVAVAVAVVLLAAGRAASWWHSPATVPDHAAPFSASAEMRFAGQNELAQRVRPKRDGFTAVDLVIAAESPDLPGKVLLRVEEWPSRRLVRQSELPAALAPAEHIWSFTPGRRSERWLTFGFAPIPDSAGRDYLFVLSYPEGRNVGDYRLVTLARFPASYPVGEIFVNGREENGTLLFRLASAGTRGEAVRGALDNLARQQPFWPGSLALPAVLVAMCGVFAIGVVAAALRR